MAHTRTYAKLVTPYGEYDMSHAELDQLRMLINMSLRTGTLPQADPPIRTHLYENLQDWIDESFDHTRKLDGDDKYLDDEESHTFDVGDYALDRQEPTPSPEANTVRIIGLTGRRADEFRTEDGKLVSEYQKNRAYPDSDLVVAGVYPNMGDPDKVWHFPESRLDPV